MERKAWLVVGLVALVGCVATPSTGDPFGMGDGSGLGTSEGEASSSANHQWTCDEQPVPDQIVTGPDGHAMLYDYWPISDNGLLVLEVSVAGLASDIATEITTGWWETSPSECHYCDTPTVNVWGHWSYTLEFQRDPSATEICRVENDHVGMAACAEEPRHIHHHPDVRACWEA